jgi:hypothetical protein
VIFPFSPFGIDDDFRFRLIFPRTMKALFSGLLCVSVLASQSAIWEFDLGGKGGPGLLAANEVQPNSSIATGKELSYYEVPGIVYDDVAKTLEFHAGWGTHETVNGAQLTGHYISSALYGPATMHENAARPLYSFDPSNGLLTGSDHSGRSALVHARVQLVELEGYSIAQQQADLLASRWYFNVLSTAFESGEIRGQLMSVPEPRHYALASGAALLAFAAVRRKFKNRP